MKRYLTPSEVAKIFSRSGVIKWIRQGKIRTVEINGMWRIPYSEVEKLLSSSGRDRQVAIYARVLSTSQKVYLETQLKALREWIKRTFNDVKVIEVSDVGLRLKEDKKGLKKLIELAKRKQIDVIVVSYKDRLTRFGFIWH